MHTEPINFLCLACPAGAMLVVLLLFWAFMEVLSEEGVRKFEEESGGPFP